MNHVIISGADGFIGTHLCKYLNEKKILVYALIMKNSQTKFRIEELEFVNIIECDFTKLSEITGNIPVNADAFFHLAWAGVAPNSRSSMEIQLKNISISLDAVRLAASVNAKKFILPGSTSEYMYSGLITGNNYPTPQNSYGASKVAVRYLCQSVAEQLEIPFIYAICAGVYGADRRDNNVIFYAIDQLLKSQIPHLTKLEQKWDYIHIDDLIGAFIAIIEYGQSGRVYPIGNGDNWPLAEYIYQIRDIINPELHLGVGDIPYPNPDKMPSSCIDTSLLYQDTGFLSQIEFKDGISEVIKKIKIEKSGA